MIPVRGGRTMSGIGTEAETKGMASRVRRHATIVRWVSLALSAVSVLLIVRRLPIGPAIQEMEGWVRDLGIWGPVVFGLIYAAAVVLMVPGSALTLAAGAIFGPLVGTMTVSLASTTGAALAFLVARYLARDAVVRQAHRHPKFDAIDRAIGENGWKIIALLRLSPAFPFGIQPVSGRRHAAIRLVGTPSQKATRQHWFRRVVRRAPCVRQRRAEVRTGAGTIRMRPRPRRRRTSSTSSMMATSGKPPISRKTDERRKRAWSP
jgi:hypothetical protein